MYPVDCGMTIKGIFHQVSKVNGIQNVVSRCMTESRKQATTTLLINMSCWYSRIGT